MSIVIRALDSQAEAEAGARMLASSEPWITLQRTYDGLLRVLSQASRERYVAMDGDRLAGVIILNLSGPLAGYLQTICVAPAHRGTGVGLEMMRFLEARIFREHPNVFLSVSSFNHGAQRFYERLGYKRIGEIENYLVQGHGEILMRKTIGPTLGYPPVR